MGKPYEDNLCFFRCLALHTGCHTKNLERETKHYYQQYREAGLSKKKFHGVKLSELDDLEKLFEVNIQAFVLKSYISKPVKSFSKVCVRSNLFVNGVQNGVLCFELYV